MKCGIAHSSLQDQIDNLIENMTPRIVLSIRAGKDNIGLLNWKKK